MTDGKKKTMNNRASEDRRRENPASCLILGNLGKNDGKTCDG